MPVTPRTSTRTVRTAVAVAASVVAAVTALVPAAAAAPSAPQLIGPSDGASIDALPVFAWQAVAGAERYEWEFSADAGFNSALESRSTRNTRASIKTTITNGRYYWRVRGVTGSGELGAWSETRSFQMAWTARPSLLTPANGATLTYPTDVFKLSWTPVPGASEYMVRVATDSSLANVVWSRGPIKTGATSFTLSSPLAPGTYFWGITPLDAEGHAGSPSPVASFTWAWPSSTTTEFTDLAAAAEMVDPYLAWARVPGAAGYEVEVNSSFDWAPGSKVCCDPLRFGSDVTTIGTSHAPPEQLDNNTYYWRVRAIDPGGNAGVWNVGPTFVKTFANVPPTPAPSVKNLRMRDNLGDAANGADPATVAYPLTTGAPVVAWNPVPGASGYQVDVTRHVGGACDWSYGGMEHWVKYTSTTAWTPLGSGWGGTKPYPDPLAVSNDGITAPVAGHSYCVRVRPVDRASTIAGPLVFGDWTYLPGNNTAAFTFAGFPGADTCWPCSMSPSNYREPTTGSVIGRMPLFTWEPIAGAQAYYVLVARDANFTNLIDYAFTQIPAYAPRTISQSKGYPDELTKYYWAVLPASSFAGGGVSAHPLESPAPSFEKRSLGPTTLAPAAGAILDGPMTFRWTPAEGARQYRLEVAQDPSFVNPIHTVVTDSTAYTSNTTYPADTVLYWRVRADAEDGSSNVVGLMWSTPSTFQKRLPAPTPDAANPTTGAFLPTMAWTPIPGAVSYDVEAVEADGDMSNFTNLPSHAFTPTKMTGKGIFQLRARANFPAANGQVVHGPYSPVMAFARTIPEPSNPASEIGPRTIAMSWSPRLGAKEYRVQISTRPDFANFVENALTQAPNWAPLLTQSDYVNGGRLYWRVAAIDADGNLGDFTAPQEFGIAQTLRVRAFGTPIKGRKTTLTVSASAARGAVAGARIRVWGAGMRSRAKFSNSDGRAIFTVRPIRRGKVYVQVTKAEFVPAQTSVAVRVLRVP
jgi:hypothetical protein